jgi:hypothetical protein
VGECEIQDGRAVLDMTAHEWTEIEARFTLPPTATERQNTAMP